MLLAAALGPVLDRPGKQPPLPSDPSGTFAVEPQSVASTPPGLTTVSVR